MAVNELLAEKLAEIIHNTPRRMEIVPATGELLSQDAMNIARAFDAANGMQQRAMLAVVESWKPPK